jgi:hypothetical protein
MNGTGVCQSSRLGRGVLFLMTLLLAQACASAGGGGGGGGGGDVITREQIGDGTNETAFTVVQRLKPGWLRARTQGSLSDPSVCSLNVCTSGEPQRAAVLVDDLVFGDINSLDRISATQIDRIEYVSAIDATTRFGTGYPGGAIIVRTVNSAR